MVDVSTDTVVPVDLTSSTPPPSNERALGKIVGDRVTLENFGRVGAANPTGNDVPVIMAALTWSRNAKQPVYADHTYNLGETIEFPAQAALVCGPRARFIRNPTFGNPQSGGQEFLVKTPEDVDTPDVLIDGGTWGPVVPDNPATFAGTVTFNAAAKRIGFLGAGYFENGFVQVTRSTGSSAEPEIDNLEVIGVGPGDVLHVSALTIDGVKSATVEQVLPGGHVFGLFSTRGVVRNVNLVGSRGIQFLVGGDNFLIHNCTSRLTARDGGGGLRINRGDGFRAYAMDLETSDDCYQFGAKDGEITNNGSVVDCIGKTYQGSLCAFILGGDGYPSDGDDTDFDPETGSIQNCFFANIRGEIGGSDRFGGYAIKFNCVNAINPIENCWANDIVARHSDVGPNRRSSIHVTVGKGPSTVPAGPGSGVIASGVRGVAIENRSGPAVQIDRFNNPFSTSTMIDFTVDGLRSKGPGTVPGAPLIEAHLGRRLVLRDVSGDLADGDATENVLPGRALDIASQPDDLLEELVIDGLAVSNARLDKATGQGLWLLGNVNSVRARRLTVAAADPHDGVGLGGLQLIDADGPNTGPEWAEFDGVDFGSLSKEGAPGAPIVSWINNSGNEIVHPIGFDPAPFSITVPASGNGKVISPPSYASVITLLPGSPTEPSYVNTMTPPPAGTSPERTLILRNRVTVRALGETNFVMGAALTGPSHTITFRWNASASPAVWQEVARS